MMPSVGVQSYSVCWGGGNIAGSLTPLASLGARLRVQIQIDTVAFQQSVLFVVEIAGTGRERQLNFSES